MIQDREKVSEAMKSVMGMLLEKNERLDRRYLGVLRRRTPMILAFPTPLIRGTESNAGAIESSYLTVSEFGFLEMQINGSALPELIHHAITDAISAFRRADGFDIQDALSSMDLRSYSNLEASDRAVNFTLKNPRECDITIASDPDKTMVCGRADYARIATLDDPVRIDRYFVVNEERARREIEEQARSEERIIAGNPQLLAARAVYERLAEETNVSSDPRRIEALLHQILSNQRDIMASQDVARKDRIYSR